ncbi:MAG TPA: GNAT family N-acetyltransferase [Pyrinomonadaceae bacterium]|jgi:ribosomal protein S18 acetylase RimI-like enzyme
MFIREASQQDVPIVYRLQRQMLAEDGIYGFVAETFEQIEKAINPYFLIAETGGEIIGFISGDVSVSDGSAVVPKGEKYLEIENLYVAPEFRKQGVGGRLVDEALTKARENGASYAMLYSASKDVHGILKFYERHNFQSWYVQMFQKL